MKFNSTNPLLMLIDLQKAIDDSSWGVRNNPNAEKRVEKILHLWRELKLPILHVKHMSTDPNSKYLPGTIGNEFKDIFIPLNSEQTLEKSTNSAFINTNLQSILHDKRISEIVIVGVITNNSVEATARNSGNMGYRTIVLSDATYTFNKTDFSGQEHEAEVVHNMSLANLNGEYAKIMNSEEVLSLARNIQQGK